MSDLVVFQVEASQRGEVSFWVAHEHHAPAAGRVREEFPKLTVVQLVKDPHWCCANIVSIIWTNTHWCPIEDEHYMVLFDITVVLHVVRTTSVSDCPWDAALGVWERQCGAAVFVTCAAERGCVPAGVGTLGRIQQLGFRKRWDALLERTWGMAVSCEKAGREIGPEVRGKGGMTLERTFMNKRQPQKGTVSLKLTPG